MNRTPEKDQSETGDYEPYKPSLRESQSKLASNPMYESKYP